MCVRLDLVVKLMMRQRSIARAVSAHPVGMSVAILIISRCAQAIPLEDFYPFGSKTPDAQLPPTDDDFAGPVNLPAPPFPFYDELYESIFVNNNGLLSFLEGVSNFSSQTFPLPDGKLIAPFWGDVDTLGTGVVWYRNTTEGDLLGRFRDMVARLQSQDSFTPSYLFIATWDHVGYFYENIDKTNTFQCVLVTDGLKSYAVFLYADGEIQWNSEDTADFVGEAGMDGGKEESLTTHAGFNAGDGINFAVLPESNSPQSIINVDNTSNVQVPGVWVFQIDGEEIVVEGVCNSVDVQPKVYINPRSGPQQGGTAVIVTGPCFEESYNIICAFGGREVEGIYISEQQALCISPQLPSFGRLTFKLTLTSTTGSTLFEGETIFFSIEVQNDNPAVNIESKYEFLIPYDLPFKVNWKEDELIPKVLMPSLGTFKVDLKLYAYKMDTEEWELLEVLLEAIDNTGEADVTTRQLSCDACPVAIAVEVSDNGGISIGRKQISLANILAGAAKLWSTLAYIAKPQTSTNALQSLCQEWCDSQPDNIGQDLLDRLPPCPFTVQRAQLDNRFRLDNRFKDFIHPGAENCFRQEYFNEGQECCYGSDGSLLVGPRGGGTVDRYTPNSLSSFWNHQFEDVLPFLYCCFSFVDQLCPQYYQKRPSSDGAGYRLAVPAYGFGDPHIVTLDTLKYTFNGKGEFTLIETTDNKFTLQGRMVAAEGDTGASVAATVFSAIVGKQDYSDAVQLELSRRGIDALVNGERVDFEDISSRDFNNVTVMDLGSRTIAARFSYGAYVEAKEENGIVSVLLVGLPDTFSGETRGLMGNFNGNLSDDLISKNSIEALSTTSSLQDIHENFGVTWIIDSPSDSLFTYKAGESFSTFYDPGFAPVLETVFSDPALEAQAMELCDGDEFCLFDIASTGRIEIGMSTLEATQTCELFLELSLPVVCDPACEDGACVANDTCKCSEGYEGERCTEKVYTECDIKDENGTEVCKNGATCMQHVLTYTCECAEGFTGSNCEEAVDVPDPEEDDDNTYIIIIAASSAGGLLLALLCLIITLLVICCCVRFRHKVLKLEAEKEPYPL